MESKVRYSLRKLTCLGANPKPIIMDRSLRTPLSSKLLSSNETVRPIIATTYVHANDTEKAERAKKLESAGAVILYCNEISEKIDLDDMLSK